MRLNAKRTIRYFISHLKKVRILMAISVMSMFFVVILELLVPYFFKIFFDDLTMGDTSAMAIRGFIKLLIIITALNFFALVFRRAGDVMNTYLQTFAMTNIFSDCFQYLHQHSYDFFTRNFTGSLVKKINRMVNAFEAIWDKSYYEILPLILRVIVIFAILFRLNWLIGILMLAWTFFFMFFNYLFTKYKWQYDSDRAVADSRITGALADTITNNFNVKLFSSLEFESARFKNIVMGWAKKMRKVWLLSVAAEGIQGVSMILLEFFIFYAAVRLWSGGKLTIGDFILIQFYLIDLFMRLWNFGRLVRDLFVKFADADEMMDILKTRHEIRDAKNAEPIHITRGKIEFSNVGFKYSGGEDVFKKLNVKIKLGERVALVGQSGGGKSTVTKLLLRLYDIQKGKILIDAQNIADVTQESLRSQISFVPQDPILFHRTLMENIRYGRRGASEVEVIAASKLAKCHDFINKFPAGYKTCVGERGVKLSGGERQRVAIARAILANAPILVLDEATSSLDSESEMLIQEALENLMKNKTTLVIAHRLSTIMRMDRILVVQDGRIAEDGTHADLLSKKSGLYKRLWNLQVGGYVD